MKILLVTSIFPPEIGGPATYTQMLAQDLALSHQVAVVTFAKKVTPKKSYQIFPVALGGNFIAWQWRLLITLLEIAGNDDVIYCQDPLVVGLASLVAAKLVGKHLVVKFVGDIVWETSRNKGRFSGSLEEFYAANMSISDRLKLMFQKRVLQSAQKVVVPSKYLERFLVNKLGISKSKIEVIYNGVEINQHPFPQKDPNLAVTVARLVPWKGISEILEVVKTIPTLNYYIVGSGPEESKLKARVKKLKLGERVKLLGVLDKSAIQKLLKKSAYFILNSSYEGLPHVLLEAAAAKNKIIAPSLPGIKEVFSNKEAWLFKPGSQEGLLSSLKFALRDKTKKEEKAFQKVTQDFNWEATFQKTTDLLERIANK